jgi:hypothetical protein
MRRDDDTGVVTRVIALDGPLTAADAAELSGHMRDQTLDETLVHYECILKDTARPLDDAVNILTRIGELRMLVSLNARGAHYTAPPEAIAKVAMDVGRRVAEARAKGHWPIVNIGRTHRRQMQDAGRRAADRWQSGRRKLAAAVTNYRQRHPTASDREIARALLPKLGRPVKLDTLRKRIARLPK